MMINTIYVSTFKFTYQRVTNIGKYVTIAV